MSKTTHPRTLGPYGIEAEIGSGGMGAVFRAYDTRLDRRVAIKRVASSSDGRGSHGRKRFLREARMVARLSHPAIVQVHDLLSDDSGEDWIVMELVKGQSLAERLRRGPLPISQVLQLGREIAEGLAHAHQHGTIHRDLKAENVMLTPEGHAKILDFGLAKQVWQGEGSADSSLTASGAVLGTLRTMSPEQARGFEIDPRSDLFSLGTLLYEMTTATRPFEGKTPVDTLTRVCAHQPPPVDSLVTDVPQGLTRLIDELLRKEPARRPDSAEEIVRRLDAISMTGTEAASDPFDRDRRTEAGQGAQTGAGIDEQGSVAHADEADTEAASDVFANVPTAEFANSPPDRRSGRKIRRVSTTAVLTAVAIVAAAWIARNPDQWTGMSDRQQESLGSPSEETKPLSTYELYRRGRELLNTFYRPKDLAAAILAFEKVLDREPKSAAAYAYLSRAFWRRYYAENRDSLWLERALSHARKAIELDPFLADARVSLALALAYLGRLDEAGKELDSIHVLDPANASIHRSRAEIHRLHGQLEEAEEAIRAAIEISPDEFDFLNLLGSILIRSGKLDEATTCFLRSIELAPENTAAYRNLAGVYYRQDRADEAARWIQNALEIRPEKTLYASLGVIYFDQGLYREAVVVFEQAIKTPGGANDYRIWANLADSYRWTAGHASEARRAYAQAIEALRKKGVHEAEDQSRLALYLAKQGKMEEARREIDEIAEGTIQEASTWYRIAVTWEILDQRVRALDSLGKALTLGYSVNALRRDPELTEMRSNAGYHRLVSTGDYRGL